MTTPAGFGYSEPTEAPPARGAAREAATTPSDLVVDVAAVAERLNVDVATLTTVQTTRITNAISDAQAAVEAEIGRPLLPATRVFYGVQPYFNAAGLLYADSWPILSRVYDDVVVTSTTARPDGLFDLTVQIGLNGRQEEPIRAFVRAHAVEAVRLDPTSGVGKLAVTSVSAEGQSISYERRSTQKGAAGALPTLSTLRRYKKLAAYQAPTRVGMPFPYSTYRR